jgi:hypothetical protein
MQNVVRCLVLLMVVGLTTGPAFAAELRLTGYDDSVLPYFRSNFSAPDSDQDVTRNHDQSTFGRTRGRMYFNVIANDDLRGVFGFELDAIWGLSAEGAVGSFDRNTDVAGNIETKWLYVDFRIPQLPIGNRVRLGGLPMSVTPLHGALVLYGDVGGGDAVLNFTDQAALHLYYVQFEENSGPGDDSFPGSTKLGEDYATGATLRLKPLDGLDLHLVGVYGHLHLPSTSMLNNSSPAKNIPSYFLNVTTESRYYVGFDSRYRLGNTSIEPSFFYLFGNRQFTSASQALTGGSETDFKAFVGNFLVTHTLGPWLFQGRFVYTSGNKANDDINNRGIGNRADVKHYSHMNADGGPMWQEWFEIFGNSEVDGTSIDTFLRMGEVGGLDRFGWQNVAGAVEYKATDRLILEGAAGAFWAAEKLACPASLRVGSITGRCGPVVSTGTPGTNNSSGEPVYNFTGASQDLGWEVAAGLRYTIMPGLTWTPRLAYADYGKGLNQNDRKAMDAWVFTNRVIYIF